MLRSYKIGSRRFDTFARGLLFCLARSCRAVEKFDKNHRFFMIFCRSGPEKRAIGSDFSATRYDLGKQKSHPSANVLNLCLRVYSVRVHRSVELCRCNDRILLKNNTIWLSGADRIGFLRNATRSRQTKKSPLSKCIELYACEFIASGSIGALSCACATIGFC